MILIQMFQKIFNVIRYIDIIIYIYIDICVNLNSQMDRWMNGWVVDVDKLGREV